MLRVVEVFKVNALGQELLFKKWRVVKFLKPDREICCRQDCKGVLELHLGRLSVAHRKSVTFNLHGCHKHLSIWLLAPSPSHFRSLTVNLYVAKIYFYFATL